MTAKLVLRLLDHKNQLLGWVEHKAIALGDGCLRAQGPVIIVADAPGFPACVSVHWCDLHVETRIKCHPGAVKAGDQCAIFKSRDPMVTLGTPPVGLPAVSTKHSVAVDIPPGQMATQGLVPGA